MRIAPLPWQLVTVTCATLALGLLAACKCPPPEQPEAPGGQPGAGGDHGREDGPGGDGEPGGEPGDDSRAETRRLLVSPDHPLYARVEGTAMDNDCRADSDCFVGGCSAEICTAERDLSSTCEARDWPTEGGRCGCVEGACSWYAGSGGGGDGSEGGDSQPEPVLPTQGETCGDDDRCASGLTCVSYYGVAGARGPEFRTCEIPCQGEGSCPDGQRCVTLADGPGPVCRPAPR